MPYSIDKKNKCVYKKKADGSRGEKVGCTRGDLQKYVSALHANVKSEAIKEMKQALLEANQEIVESPVQLANNVEFYVVEKSKDPMDDPMKLYFKTDPIGFANQIRGGLLPEDIHGIYISEDEALNAAHDQVQSVYEAAKNLEAKKNTVTEKLQKKIQMMQKEVDGHLKAAKNDPQNADAHQTKAEEVLSRIREYRAKHQVVEKAKKPLEEKEKEDKKKINEDHEVSMAQNSLKTIISSASKLINLLGQEEKDIPAWIQDHITNAENYINQASQNYHEYGSEHNKVLPEVKKKAKKDYDGDGKVETPAQEYKGVKDKAIKKSMKNKQ